MLGACGVCPISTVIHSLSAEFYTFVAFYIRILYSYCIEYRYKLGQKHEFKFLCELGWFAKTVHVILYIYTVYVYSTIKFNVTYSSIGIPQASACISYNATGFPQLNLQWRVRTCKARL